MNMGLWYWDLVIFFIEITFLTSVFIGAYFNLVKKQISPFGFDTFIWWIAYFIDQKQAKVIKENPQLIRRIGICMLLMIAGGIPEVISQFIRDIWPYLISPK